MRQNDERLIMLLMESEIGSTAINKILPLLCKLPTGVTVDSVESNKPATFFGMLPLDYAFINNAWDISFDLASPA